MNIVLLNYFREDRGRLRGDGGRLKEDLRKIGGRIGERLEEDWRKIEGRLEED